MQSSLKLIIETTLKLCGRSLWCAGNRYRRCYSDVEVSNRVRCLSAVNKTGVSCLAGLKILYKILLILICVFSCLKLLEKLFPFP